MVSITGTIYSMPAYVNLLSSMYPFIACWVKVLSSCLGNPNPNPEPKCVFFPQKKIYFKLKLERNQRCPVRETNKTKLKDETQKEDGREYKWEHKTKQVHNKNYVNTGAVGNTGENNQG